MARLYSGKKGRSGSTKPVRKVPPSWLKYKPNEVEKLVLKLAKEEKSTSEIGTILRDTYGIPNVKSVTGKKINAILKENKVNSKIPEDLANIIKRIIAITTHLNTNKHDQTAKRGLQLTESKLRRMVTYYTKRKMLPEGWKYSREKLKLLLE